MHTHLAYRSVTGFDFAWTGAVRADPCPAERNALSGNIAVGHVTQDTDKVKIVLDNTTRS